ncbi:MAG: hypothetical protein EZS28_042803, partial [Streblomastix strix]
KRKIDQRKRIQIEGGRQGAYRVLFGTTVWVSDLEKAKKKGRQDLNSQAQIYSKRNKSRRSGRIRSYSEDDAQNIGQDDDYDDEQDDDEQDEIRSNQYVIYGKTLSLRSPVRKRIYKAREIPAAVLENRYQQMMEQKQQRSEQIRAQSKDSLQKDSAAFSFYDRDSGRKERMLRAALMIQEQQLAQLRSPEKKRYKKREDGQRSRSEIKFSERGINPYAITFGKTTRVKDLEKAQMKLSKTDSIGWIQGYVRKSKSASPTQRTRKTGKGIIQKGKLVDFGNMDAQQMLKYSRRPNRMEV